MDSVPKMMKPDIRYPTIICSLHGVKISSKYCTIFVLLHEIFMQHLRGCALLLQAVQLAQLAHSGLPRRAGLRRR